MTKGKYIALITAIIFLLFSAFGISYLTTKSKNKVITGNHHIVEYTEDTAMPETTNRAHTKPYIPKDRVYKREVAFDEIKEISGWQDWACNRFLDTMELGGIETTMILMGSNNESNINIVTFAVYAIDGELYEVHTNYPYCSIKSIEKNHKVIYENGKYVNGHKTVKKPATTVAKTTATTTTTTTEVTITLLINEIN
jgi:hypothetical protein